MSKVEERHGKWTISRKNISYQKMTQEERENLNRLTVITLMKLIVKNLITKK